MLANVILHPYPNHDSALPLNYHIPPTTVPSCLLMSALARSATIRDLFLNNSTLDSAKSLLIVLRNEVRSTSQYFESIDTVNLQKYQLLKINFKSGFFQLKAGNYLNVYFSKRFLTFLGFVLIKKAVFLNLSI